MVSNNEAVENFLNGKRNLAAFQFNQLIREIATNKQQQQQQQQQQQKQKQEQEQEQEQQQKQQQQQQLQQQKSEPSPPASIDLFGDEDDDDDYDYRPSRTKTPASKKADEPTTSGVAAAAASTTATTSTAAEDAQPASPTADPDKKQPATMNCDEVAFNYAMVNLFTGCPTRASMIFSDLVKRYPRNPRLWLRLAESMMAAERSKLADEYEHIQQLIYPRDPEIKSKNRPILIKINPNYCHQQKSQQSFNKAPRETPPNFLMKVMVCLQNSLNLIEEYNDISLLTDDNPSIMSQSPQLMPTSSSTSDTLLASVAATNPAAQETAGASTSSSSAVESAPTTATATASTEAATSKAATASSSTSATLPGTELSRQLSYANPYKSISRSALYHLRIKVQLNIAYVCLCMGQSLKALKFTTQCLKASPQGYEKVLASLYHAEACILAARIDEAIQFLNLEVLNMAKNLSRDQWAAHGRTKQRVVYDDEMQNQIDRGALATVVTYNLSVAYAAKGEFLNAQKILMRCLKPTKSIPMQLIICLLYIQLQLGQVEAAKKTILSNLPQFR